MSFYVLRAASQVGHYEELYPTLMKPWDAMIEANLTTWVEDDVMFRSDCHGWSSSSVYEIVHEIFDLSPAEKGYQKIQVRPRFKLQRSAKGTFVIADGTVDIGWDPTRGFEIKASRDIAAEIVIKNFSHKCTFLACVPMYLTTYKEWIVER